MSTFPVELVSPVSGIDRVVTEFRLLIPHCSKWLTYNCANHEVKEITSSAGGIAFRLPIMRQGILVFIHHKEHFRLALASDAAGYKRETSVEGVLAIRVGEEYEFWKDKQKLEATMKRLMDDDRYQHLLQRYIGYDR